MNLSPAYPRIVGLLTAAYGAYTALRPASLVHAAELEARGSGETRTGRALGIALGARDVLSGLSMMLATPGAPLRSAVAARVAFDLGDVVAFGIASPPSAKAKVMGVAAGWAAVCAAALPSASRVTR
ncbi:MULTISPECIES: hypothetical protein [unclassified Rhodococcus (in: high G+C Gram-positive bacteria)]|uniref:hypothetical protein n=1 Tax=Rhodococcus sp. SJ-3 TaxID=3454628 RepID=UPI003F7A046D